MDHAFGCTAAVSTKIRCTALRRHARWRIRYADGFCAVGDFIALRQASVLVHGRFFVHPRLTATLRFSTPSRVSAAGTWMFPPCGLALRLAVRGYTLDLVMMSMPVLASAPLSSNALVEYVSLHSFLLTGRDGKTNKARFLLQPEINPHYLCGRQPMAVSISPEREMDERLLCGPINFVLLTRLAKQDVLLGQLRIIALLECDNEFPGFSPTNLLSAIELAGDTAPGRRG